MLPFPNEDDLLAWKQAYRTLQAPSSDTCLHDEQFLAMVLEDIQGEVRVGLADHIVQCQRCTAVYQWLLRWCAPGL